MGIVGPKVIVAEPLVRVLLALLRTVRLQLRLCQAAYSIVGAPFGPNNLLLAFSLLSAPLLAALDYSAYHAASSYEGNSKIPKEVPLSNWLDSMI